MHGLQRPDSCLCPDKKKRKNANIIRVLCVHEVVALVLRCDFLARKPFDCIFGPERNIKVSMAFELSIC